MRFFFYGDAWAPHLAELVKAKGHQAKSITYPDINPILMLKALFWSDFAFRVGYRPGTVGRRIKILDFCWALYCLFKGKRKSIIYWIGTDVLDQISKPTKLSYASALVASLSEHWSNAPWLRDELLSVNISSSVVLFPAGMMAIAGDVAPPLPQKLRVATYIPDHRSDFYGGASITSAARAFPEIDFLVVAGTGRWLHEKNELPNLVFCGFVENMSDIYSQVSIVIRLVQHDAIGGTVREGLAHGRHVIYSYPLPHCIHVPFGDTEGLIRAIDELRKRHNQQVLEINTAGAKFANSSFDTSHLTDVFISEAVRP